ncbi:hypothetical protein [Aeromonas hydrophila]|uniref:Uncharacterized protein n=1 Tax=Aeromonas hydrophila subsp. hydrophila (strain ATCC 7966 / DSM 30187 / BCRC 13018 / CCUG 14551 / JCM 1027 / KCTC 2358 / NCIMB 9240 / NCTC 8049) TaxID=380703 RepID=A0KHN1_AERHH|nr:hypothetical protein [Aeromonas hydrophila]ABK37808.1 hypothetical protein AHA_1241 [Aeromonas hydrophila subsp. hydrophila ATCC 7966]MBS4670451.1 hypothetical protein [Aeromonas hydrophila]OOD31407.1 hypothetical protein BWP11_16330 [Aeromonas hydrophila]
MMGQLNRETIAVERYESGDPYFSIESLLVEVEYVADGHYGLSLESTEICHEFDPANIPLLLAE